MFDPAKEMRVPQLALARLVSQRFEGDGDLDRVAFIGHDALRFHDDVYAVILAVALGEDTVELYAERIEEERVSAAPVVEGVQVEADVIIVKNLIAFGHGRAHLSRFVRRTKADVQMLLVIAEQDLGRLGRGDVIAGLDLVEILYYRGLGPYVVVEPAVNCGRRVEASDPDGRRFLGRQRDLALPDWRFRFVF